MVSSSVNALQIAWSVLHAGHQGEAEVPRRLRVGHTSAEHLESLRVSAGGCQSEKTSPQRRLRPDGPKPAQVWLLKFANDNLTSTSMLSYVAYIVIVIATCNIIIMLKENLNKPVTKGEKFNVAELSLLKEFW